MREVSAGRGWLGRRPGAGAILVTIGLVGLGPRAVLAQPSAHGQWSTLPYLMPVNPVHLALLNNGNVLIVAGSGNVPTETNFEAAVWDRSAGIIVTQPLSYDMFCNGLVILPDGRVLINGGTLQFDPFHGEARSSAYDPATGEFTELANMAHGRWYPTVTTLGDGRVMAFSGLTETGGTNSAVEIYTVGSGWSSEYPAGWTPPLYPRMHLMTDGRVFYSGSGTGSQIFDPSTHTWSGVMATTNYGGTRTYGSSVLLPLTPSNGYKPRVMIMGGGNPATATTEIIDLSSPNPQWHFGPPMSQPRIEMNATILPNGKVLALGGSTNDEDAATASLNADLYDPTTNTFSSAGANVYPRLYHSGSLLLPDATVMIAGGNPMRGSYEQHIEVYSPSYLFNADGSLAQRPAIAGVAPGTFSYGGTFQVQTPDAANITSVALVRPGAPTHAFDMDQRLVGLSYTVGAGVLNVTAPPNGNIAPPGYYMLFVLNSAGVPSVATFVQLTDGKKHPAVYRPSTGQWLTLDSSIHDTAGNGPVSWGGGTAIPVPADYDGDGQMDPAVYFPSTGQWWILYSSTGYATNSGPVSWGGGNAIPVPGDYDGDGKADPAVYFPSTGQWWILYSSTHYTTNSGPVSWGGGTAIPVQGDYDGDGKADPAVYFPSTGQWWIRYSSTHYKTNSGPVSWGGGTGVAVPGDYDGDGKTDPAVYFPSTGQWWILYSSARYTTNNGGVSLGISGDIPVPGDYDGDGKTDPAVYRPSIGQWWILYSSTRYTTSGPLSWGVSTDTPIGNAP